MQQRQLITNSYCNNGCFVPTGVLLYFVFITHMQVSADPIRTVLCSCYQTVA